MNDNFSSVLVEYREEIKNLQKQIRDLRDSQHWLASKCSVFDGLLHEFDPMHKQYSVEQWIEWSRG